MSKLGPTLEKIYSGKHLGYGYEKYANKLKTEQLLLKIRSKKTKSQEITNEISELKELCKTYYLMAIKLGNTKCIKKLAELYVQNGEYEQINELIKFTNYYDDNLDECNEWLMNCSIVNKDRLLVELHYEKIINKSGTVYFSIGTYYKNIKEDQLAIKNFKHASDNRNIMANHMLGSWYEYTKDKTNATKYFLKIFSYNVHYMDKIYALRRLIELNNDFIVENMLKNILSTCCAILLSKNTSKYKRTSIEKYKKCCEFLKAYLLRKQNKFDDFKLMITELYNNLISTNDLIKNMTTENIVLRLNAVFIEYEKNRKKLKNNIYVHINILTWFEYHKINKNHNNLFLQYPLIAKLIDKWIKKTEKYYMQLEDKRLSK